MIARNTLIILSVGQFFNAYCGSIGYLLNMTGKEKIFKNAILIGAILNIILNFVLIPYWGIIGAAVASAVSYFIMAALMFVVTHKIYPVPYEYIRLAKIAAAAGICFLGGYIEYQPLQPYLKIVSFILFPVILKAVGFFEREEIAKYKEKIRLLKSAKNSE